MQNVVVFYQVNNARLYRSAKFFGFMFYQNKRSLHEHMHLLFSFNMTPHTSTSTVVQTMQLDAY